MESIKKITKERRNKLEIYFDIIKSIDRIKGDFGGIKPTKVQQSSNLSYDKFTRYLIELENKKFIIREPSIEITSKGMLFLKDYRVIKEFIEKMGIENI